MPHQAHETFSPADSAKAAHAAAAPGQPGASSPPLASFSSSSSAFSFSASASHAGNAADDDGDAHLDALLAEITPHLARRSAYYDARGEFPHAHFELLHRYGLIAQVVPREYGGAGATLAQARRIVAAVARQEAATALVLTMTYLQHHLIARAGNAGNNHAGSGKHGWPESLRRQVFESAVSRGALINAFRVEPDLGSPSRGGLPATVIRRVGDGWRLSGRKIYTTGIPALSWIAVWARTDETPPRVGVVLVPLDPAQYARQVVDAANADVPNADAANADAPAGASAFDGPIRVIENWNHLGLRASASHETIFDDLPLPLENAVDLRRPEDWEAESSPSWHADFADQQAWMITLLGTLYDAVAGAARDWLFRFANVRVPTSLGAPLATLPRVQEKAGEIDALLRASRVLLDDLAARTDAGNTPGANDSGLVKFIVTSHAIRATELALQLSGNYGLSRHNPLERYHRDVLCSRIHTPQDDAILVTAGRAALAGYAASAAQAG